MPWEIIVTSSAASVLITTLGGIITVIVSNRAARKAAKEAAAYEVDKIQQAWAREDAVAFDSEFSQMIRLAILFALKTNVGQPDTLAEIGAIRAKESGELAEALDELYCAVKLSHYHEADKCIDKVIQIKRKSNK